MNQLRHPWRVLRLNGLRFTSIMRQVEALGICVYAPKRLELRKRKDRPGYNCVEVRLFSDYVLLNFDVFKVHTSEVTAINGTRGFVSFGNQEPAWVDQSCIDKLEMAIKKHNDKILNKGPVTIGGESSEQTYRVIVQGKTQEDRERAWYSAMQLEHIKAAPNSANSAAYTIKPVKLIIAY